MTSVERFRHSFAPLLIGLLWANAALLFLVSFRQDVMIPVAGTAFAVIATLAWLANRTGWVTRQTSSAAVLGQVMLLVYAFREHPYQSDMHMYFFAMLAVLSFRFRPLFWTLVMLFNALGVADIVTDYIHGVQFGLPELAGQLGAAYLIPIIYVPLLTITHFAAFGLLLGRRSVAAQRNPLAAPAAE